MCESDCNLVLDRLLEHEGGHVLACVATVKERWPETGAQRSCDDSVWARCAALIGPHADGGPPAPPKSEDFEFENGD